MSIYDRDFDGPVVKRRGFLATVIALMYGTQLPEPFKVTDEHIIPAFRGTGNLRSRLMRMSRLRESQLLRFRCLLDVSKWQHDDIITVLTAPFENVGKVDGHWSWGMSRFNPLITLSAHAMTLVDDEGYVLRHLAFNGGSQFLGSGDQLKMTYGVDMGNTDTMPLRDWPSNINLGDWTITPETLCDQINVAHFLGNYRAIV